MHIALDSILPLLHCCEIATIATHARKTSGDAAGYPFPTLLPFAPDAVHRPVILVSRLAEHTRNLHEDARAGFLLFDPRDSAGANGPRLTLTGEFEPVATDEHARRYLRYHPDAERYLALGDFAFFRLKVKAMRYIGGFGAMGWLEGTELEALVEIDGALETEIIDSFASALRAEQRIIGVDSLGIDLTSGGARLRRAFAAQATGAHALHAAVAAALAAEDRNISLK